MMLRKELLFSMISTSLGNEKGKNIETDTLQALLLLITGSDAAGKQCLISKLQSPTSYFAAVRNHINIQRLTKGDKAKALTGVAEICAKCKSTSPSVSHSSV
jgi:hypothetical protein